MTTLGERSGKKPRWADLQDSTEELLSDVPPPLLHVDSYDASQSQEFDGSKLSEMRRAFSSTMSGVLCKTDPPVGDPLVGAAQYTPHNGKDDAKSDNKAGINNIDRRTPPRGPKTRLRERLQGTPSPQVAGNAAAAKRASRRAGHGTAKANPHSTVDVVRKRALETGQQAGLDDEVSGVVLIEDDVACHADCEETQQRDRVNSQAGGEDEDWARRFEKRQGIVAQTKASPQYLAHAARRAVGCADAFDVPRTPDPSYRDVSKRAWERSVMDWRVALRQPDDSTP